MALAEPLPDFIDEFRHDVLNTRRNVAAANTFGAKPYPVPDHDDTFSRSYLPEVIFAKDYIRLNATVA